MKRICLLTITVVVGLALMVTGCGDSDSTTENTTVNENEQNSEQEHNENTCTPRDECTSDECGDVDDGCGGTIDCGECPCQNGTPQSETCGACDLGVLQCDDGETGPGQCDKPTIPGLDGDCSKLVAVSASSGSNLGSGSVDDPVSSLDDAMSIAREHSGAAILIGGSNTYDGPLVIDEPISVIGGFSEDFRRDSDQTPTIHSSESVDGLDDDIAGVAFRDVSEPTVIANLSIQTADAEAPGATNYGAYVFDSTDITFRNVETIAGKGGEGEHGIMGEDGADGEPGDDALAMVGSTVLELYLNVGDGGTNPECPEADGGDGGRGAHDSGFMTPSGPDQAEDGQSSSDASGGEAGDECDEVNNPETCAGGNGADAATLSGSGDSGVGGQPGGEVSDGQWSPTGAGSDGEDGAHGSGGGGGGGGSFDPDWDDPKYGTYGGGGGAGGCGGEGGTGGGPGGGSFGLFVYNSDVAAIDSSFTAGPGGDGGEARPGGLGGHGASGGAPTDQRCSVAAGCENISPDVVGGHGGHGADGTSGGTGGGGAGGVSYGAYCHYATLDTSGTVEVSGGLPAEGGHGAEFGEDGLTVDDHNC